MICRRLSARRYKEKRKHWFPLQVEEKGADGEGYSQSIEKGLITSLVCESCPACGLLDTRRSEGKISGAYLKPVIVDYACKALALGTP